jgi:pyridoxamine 5'-phosphate oxidase
VPLPPFWGGYRVVPETIELWTHRDDRLHERVRYERDGAGWTRALLAP